MFRQTSKTSNRTSGLWIPRDAKSDRPPLERNIHNFASTARVDVECSYADSGGPVHLPFWHWSGPSICALTLSSSQHPSSHKDFLSMSDFTFGQILTADDPRHWRHSRTESLGPPPPAIGYVRTAYHRKHNANPTERLSNSTSMFPGRASSRSCRGCGASRGRTAALTRPQRRWAGLPPRSLVVAVMPATSCAHRVWAGLTIIPGQVLFNTL
ncbi:hypothetical protein BC834DRAFT_883874 [Gloeopeniophorella convolvens]|nr:hypothetical protein BC834DRAFT_883874 [Gloeopeniophorella convolvens]